MDDFQQYASYGAWGVAAWVVYKFVMPFLTTLASKTSTEGVIYNKAKDSISHAYKQLEHQQKRYDDLLTKYETMHQELITIKQQLADERMKREQIERQLNLR